MEQQYNRAVLLKCFDCLPRVHTNFSSCLLMTSVLCKQETHSSSYLEERWASNRYIVSCVARDRALAIKVQSASIFLWMMECNNMELTEEGKCGIDAGEKSSNIFWW